MRFTVREVLAVAGVVFKNHHNIMQTDINKIELCGLIGTVRLNEVQGQKVANFSLKTEYGYINKDGFVLCETTWHNVTVWQNEEMPPLEQLEKGLRVHVTGRLRNNKYTGTDGTERVFIEVLADSLKIVNS